MQHPVLIVDGQAKYSMTTQEAQNYIVKKSKTLYWLPDANVNPNNSIWLSYKNYFTKAAIDSGSVTIIFEGKRRFNAAHFIV